MVQCSVIPAQAGIHVSAANALRLTPGVCRLRIGRFLIKL